MERRALFSSASFLVQQQESMRERKCIYSGVTFLSVAVTWKQIFYKAYLLPTYTRVKSPPSYLSYNLPVFQGCTKSTTVFDTGNVGICCLA